MATQQEIDQTKAQISGLTPEQQTGAKALAENYMGQGKNAIDASNLALSSYATAPVAPVTAPAPVIQPETPAPVVNQPETPQIEATPTPAPVTTQEPVKTTIEPVKTQENTNVVNLNDRQNQILANLNEGAKNAPELFNSIDTFRNAYGYNQKPIEEQKILDAFYQSKKGNLGTSDGIFNALSTNQPIFNQDVIKTPEYKIAKNRLDTLNQYRNYGTDELKTLMSEGKLLEGTQLYKDLSSDPKIKLALDNARKLNAINNVPTDTNKVVTNVMNDIVDGTAIGNAFKDGIITAQEMNQMTSSPEIDAKANEVEKKKTAYDTVKAEYDDVENSVEQELKGKDVTSSYKQALIGERQKNIFKRLSVLTSDYNNSLGTLSDMKKTQADLMATNIDLYKTRQSQQAQQDLATFQSDLALSNSQKEFEQKIAQQTAMANDPVMATQGIIDTYKKLGVIPQRSDSEIIADIQSQVAAGTPLGTALTNLNKAFQSKPEYKAIMTPKDNGNDFKVIGKDDYGNDVYGFVNTKNSTVTPFGNLSTSGTINTSGGTDLSSLYNGNNGPAFANNNPGNIKDIGFGGTTGQGGFTKFETVEQGISALTQKIDNAKNGNSKVYSPDMTLTQFFQKYAPSSDNNNPIAYAQAVAQGAGVSPSTKIKNIDTESMAIGIIKRENGAVYNELIKRGIIGPEGINLGTQQAQTQFNPDRKSLYEATTMPSAEVMKSMGITADKFLKEREAYKASQTQNLEGANGPIDVGSGAPITYARRIKSMVPATLMNSEIELKNLNDTIGSLYKSGTSPEDAALMYMGVDLKPENKENGMKMIDILKGSNAQPSVYTSIADNLNKGNARGAVQLLENTIYKDRGVNTSDISEIGNNIKNGQNLINRINLLKDKFGPVSGNETKWAQYIKDDKESQRLLSDMTNFVAKYRNGIAGTSVTANEEDFLNNIIPTITNKPENAIAKIDSNIGQAFNGLNTIRDTVGLPSIQDMKGSYDIEFRKNAYTGENTQSKVKTTSGKTFNRAELLNQIK